MAKDDSEEAVFEPSARRLSQLRDQGQVPRSQELTGAVELLAVLGYLVAARDGIMERFRIAFRDAPIFAPIDFWERVGMTVAMMGELSLQILAPILAITVASALLTTILDVGGFLFSVQALMPNFGKFNPAEGIKNLFTLKNLIELIKSIAKIVIFAVCLHLLVLDYVNDAFWSPTCGVACVLEVALAMMTYIIIIGAVLLIVFAAIDFVISRWLFTRDNRMTLTEMKRENKESFGDPHVRSARNQERRRMAESAGLTGPNAANLWIVGPGGTVGITYKPEQSGVPIVAAKGDAETAGDFLAAAREKGVAISQNPELYAKLAELGRVGQPIPRETFTAVAQALVRAGFSG